MTPPSTPAPTGEPAESGALRLVSGCLGPRPVPGVDQKLTDSAVLSSLLLPTPVPRGPLSVAAGAGPWSWGRVRSRPAARQLHRAGSGARSTSATVAGAAARVGRSAGLGYVSSVPWAPHLGGGRSALPVLAYVGADRQRLRRGALRPLAGPWDRGSPAYVDRHQPGAASNRAGLSVIGAAATRARPSPEHRPGLHPTYLGAADRRSLRLSRGL